MENLLKYLQSSFNNNHFLNQNVINDCLKILQNSINSLKKESKNLVKKTFNAFFEYISGFQFPKDNISDENKTLINIFLDFIKAFINITLETCGLFFENNGIDNLMDIDFIIYNIYI